MPTPATYRRRRLAALLIAVVVVGGGLYGTLTLLAPVRGVAATVTAPAIPPTAAAQPGLPSYGASAVGVVGYPQAAATAGRTDAVPMASISKVITALVVLQAKPLKPGEAGPTITMTSDDVALYRHYLSLDGEVVQVQPGFRFSELDLLKLALVKSANNYAGSLALWAFGSSAGYADAATAWLSAHGLTGIHVVEPTGIDPRNVGTASDLVELGELALQDPVVAPIVSSATATVPNVGSVRNTNTLLGTDGVDGVKTGTLNDWGANLLFASDRTIGGKAITIVGVVLGGRDHATIDRDIRALIRSVVAGFHVVTLASRGQVFGGYTMPWGQRAELVATKKVTTLVWGAVTVAPRVTAENLTTAVRGADVGTARFTVAGTTLSVPLELSRGIQDPGWGWRLGHPGIVFGGV
ncbi:D-alanyl-D-alanine carboxypeptidase family protein [Pseudolysinimonas kribbensis]|uniref:Penicillin-binding protein n=1 Tax=Pseudolysinimonas kribbensis TaxID=433641 RepID=A0ABQ6JY30_9MICO|nr:D-alanyl-D-alanine carboxypeptidase [Pseudolysinimonas kribbensis]GMA93221.1 penicillin-binding protein [Pseudolysinimonas kribbensis]GMA97129.1 penicillin-binding protein [Pseudolysinimonas kribbensis]